ncbi:ATP-binding protein [uncultured Desulfosarcina sp.]|uniref:ATP-binding protein n=1 Tax=uncultured Desulfosarcina sp. TaxID=218289 RepID=UPI0029C8D6EA|nr:ATP-binding protein [uncultured Desulfosarcina sp.]
MNAIAPDSSHQNELKQQLRQLESIAALSGGIAHDYNNLLTAIMGNLSLALETMDADAEVTPLIENALAASRIAKTLTRTLITFSKGGLPAKTPTDIVRLVKNTAAFSLSGSNIRCEMVPASGIWPALVDAQQVGQAIHNLMINAAESMPSGGTVSIRFGNTTLDSPNTTLPPGNYVHIAIEDHGFGISIKNIDKIFDPYFSTKGKGEQKGTGLGLSISHSIIAKHGGKITVHSRVGVGSTFHILLPASDPSAKIEPPKKETKTAAQPEKAISGRGKILVMDDEVMILELAGNMLQHLGYEVDFAEEGETAVHKYKSALASSAPYDAVILDLTIKGGMGGEDTIRQLKEIDPSVKAIVSSGYSENPVVANYADYGFCDVVAKPYEMVEFSQKLHRVVNAL